MHEPSIKASYFGCALHPAKVQRLVPAATQLLSQYNFDAIAFCGMSGAVIAPILAFALNKSLIVVRKPKHSSGEHHSPYQVEGDRNTQRYLIVDDFRCSGMTVQYILTEVREFAPLSRCIGAMFYQIFMDHGGPLLVEATREMYEVSRSSIFNPDYLTPELAESLKPKNDTPGIQIFPDGTLMPVTDYDADIPF